MGYKPLPGKHFDDKRMSDFPRLADGGEAVGPGRPRLKGEKSRPLIRETGMSDSLSVPRVKNNVTI